MPQHRLYKCNYTVVEKRVGAICEESAEEPAGSRAYFEKVSDWRQRITIVDYPCAGLLDVDSKRVVVRGTTRVAGFGGLCADVKPGAT